MAKKTATGHWFGGGRNGVVILRSTGQVLNNVTVDDASFMIEMTDLGTRTIATTRIKSIVYKNLPTYPTDSMRLLDGTELNGTITNDPVTISTVDLGDVALPKKNILSIIF